MALNVFKRWRNTPDFQNTKIIIFSEFPRYLGRNAKNYYCWQCAVSIGLVEFA